MTGHGYEFYARQYARFASDSAAAIRREVYGEDLGQTGWRSLAEQARIAALIREADPANVLDVACGSGGPSLALVAATGCRLTGVDIEQAGIDQARRLANAKGLQDRASFAVADCSATLRFEAASFDVIVCIDAINHLADRKLSFADWARLLRPGGLVVFTDGAVLTGPISRDELNVRASQGPFAIVPSGFNEEAIASAGLALRLRDDTTMAVAEIAGGLKAARERRTAELLDIEGVEWFEARQRFLEMTSRLAASRQLSRYFYIAEKSVR